MKIINVYKFNSQNNVNFAGKKFYTSAFKEFKKLKLSDAPSNKEFDECRDIYDNLWKELNLPENLKPELQFKALLSIMEFSPRSYSIEAEKRISPFKMRVKNKSGENKANLRHEIEHVIQVWDIVRAFGINKLLKKDKITPSLRDKYEEIIQTLGKIPKNSEDYLKAKKYLDSYKQSPNFALWEGLFKHYLKMYEYYTNTLEKCARKAAKKYQPSFFKSLKVKLIEFCKLFYQKNS